jgi:hypothetical protein
MYVVNLSPPEFHARLPLDALDRANRHVLSGVRNRHDLLCIWMPEMVMTAGRSEMDPSGLAQLPDDRAAVHLPNHVAPRHGGQAERRPEEPP